MLLIKPSLSRMGRPFVTSSILAAISQTHGMAVASLYTRLAGYDKIAAVVCGLFARADSAASESNFAGRRQFRAADAKGMGAVA